jgi:tRNA G18 (ribose-2'-O)-methylase SpoU
MNIPKKLPDDRFSLWLRNVVDKYKSLPNEEIKLDLQKTALHSAIMMSQVEGDFNFGNVVRTANFFNLQCVYYFGKKHWDRRSSLGVQTYTKIEHIGSVEEIAALKTQYRFVGLENNVDRKTINIFNYTFQPNTLLIVGEESVGLSSEIMDLCDDLVEINSFGSVRSLNVASAASIAIGLLSAQIRKL